MIFVTVGTHHQPFDRLVGAADNLAEGGEDVVVQYGHSRKPDGAEGFDFCTEEEMIEYMEEARVVVTHAGIGTITDALRLDKPTVVVPRREKYGEHVDDHQLDIAAGLEEYVTVVHGVNGIGEAIESAEKPDYDEESMVMEIIKEFLEL